MTYLVVRILLLLSISNIFSTDYPYKCNCIFIPFLFWPLLLPFFIISILKIHLQIYLIKCFLCIWKYCGKKRSKSFLLKFHPRLLFFIESRDQTLVRLSSKFSNLGKFPRKWFGESNVKLIIIRKKWALDRKWQLNFGVFSIDNLCVWC